MSDRKEEYKYEEKALTLVTEDPSNGKFIINQDAIDFIRSVPEPLAIISVAGLYRTGKSYLLNRMLLNTKSGFGVASTVNPCTKGLWIWGKPIQGLSPEGDPINVLVIDTEGLGALDRDTNYDSRIFSLSVLVASCFLYNSVGNIDEQALELLAFVVNLTKQIQIRANPNEDVDFEDYAKYFPSFLWILRDFSLQLLGQDGETITSKDYLERALKPQKGLSEGIESKNRIRKHIAELFTERDCFTFVRPVTKESDLHNLSNFEINELRPEFADQVAKFKKRVLEGIKPKKLNGTLVNGAILAELVYSYVDAINNGAVPNIENTWTRICRDECSKRVDESIKLYDQYLMNELYNKIPLPEIEIKAFYKKYKEETLKYFKKKAIGDLSKDYEKELLTQIKFKANQIMRTNNEESRKLCENLLSKEFHSIEKKVRNNEYQNFASLISDINLFYTYFMEKGPEIPNKEVALLDFLLESVKKAALAFLRNSENETQTQRTMSNEIKQRHDNYVNELKNEFMREKSSLSAQVSQLQTEKAELEIRESNFKETLQNMKSEFTSREKLLKTELNKEKTNNKVLSEELQSKATETQSTIRELEQKFFLAKSEHEKEKALLEQKAHLLEKSLEEHMSKERDQKSQLNSYKSDFNSQIKDLTIQYETNLKQLNKKISALTEKIIEQEDQLKQKEILLEDFQCNSIQDAYNKDEVVLNYVEKIKSLEVSLIDYKNEHEEEVNHFRQKYEETIRNMKKQLEDSDSALKEREDKIKMIKLKSDKEKAVLQQKIDFLDVQISELKSQLEKSRRDHDKILETFEKSHNENKIDPREINELKQAHENEIKRIQDEFEITQRKLNTRNEELSNKFNEMQLKYQLRETEYATQFTKLRQELETLSNSKVDLANQNKTLEAQKKKILDEVELRYRDKIRDLERQLEEKAANHEEELSQLQRKSEEALAQVRTIFEVEKQRFEKRVYDDKEKNSNSLAQQVEDLEQKLDEERNSHEEEMEALNEQFREKESHLIHQLQQFEHEIDLRQQSIDNLNKYLKETKDSLNQVQANHNQIIEQQLDTFNRERKSFLDKIEELTLNNTKLEKEIYGISQKIQNLEESNSQKEEALALLKKETSEEKANLKKKYETEKQEYLKNSDNYLTSKVEAAKEIALLTQQNEFLQKRYDDLKKQNEELSVKLEETIKNQKENYSKELNALIDKFSGERVVLEEKYEQKRKSAKEMEIAFQKKLTQLEKDKVILVAQVATLEAKKAEFEKKIANETDTYAGQINELRENYVIEKKAQANDIERYREKISQLEHDLAELQSNYDRDRALWEGKYSFLEQQKDQAKSDLLDAQKKFEFALQQLQKARSADKETNESNQHSLIASIEKRYASRMMEIQEAQNNQIKELLEKKEKLEKEVKSLNERFLLEDFGKRGNSQIFEKKMQDLLENEKKLLKEIDDLKNERDSRTLEFQKKFDKESDLWRAKIRECEQKVKESETKRSLTLFEYEKEKAKWNVERDYLINQTAELQNSMKKIEKKKEQLLVENEKMKSTRKSNPLNNSINSNGYKGGLLSRREASHSPIGKRYGRVMMEIDDNISYNMKTFEAFRNNHLFDGKTNSTASNVEDDHEKCDTEGDSISRYSYQYK